MDVSVIMVSYNTRDMLREALHSLVEHATGVEYEVIVVDNASEDGSVEMLRTEFPDVKVMQSGGNLGFGRANNLGFEVARGKYLFLLNTDTLLLGNAVALLRDHLDNHPEVGACGGNLCRKNGAPAFSYGRLPHRKDILYQFVPAFLGRSGAKKNYSRNDTPKPVGYVSGADMMVRTEVIQRVGGFDPDFFMYCEEVELACRIHRAGWRIDVVPQARIVHFGGGGQPSDMALRRRQVSLYILYRKLFGKTYVGLFHTATQIRCALRWLVGTLTGRRSQMYRFSKQFNINRDAFRKYRNQLCTTR